MILKQYHFIPQVCSICFRFALVEAALYSTAFCLCISTSLTPHPSQSKPPYKGLVLNEGVKNCYMHFEHPKVSLKLANPQTFLVAGISHAMHAKVALRFVYPSVDDTF